MTKSQSTQVFTAIGIDVGEDVFHIVGFDDAGEWPVQREPAIPLPPWHRLTIAEAYHSGLRANRCRSRLWVPVCGCLRSSARIVRRLGRDGSLVL